MKTPEEQAEIGKQNPAKGRANENRLLAALLDRGYNASGVDMPHSPYDIVTELRNNDYIQIQAKTVGKNNSVPFTGGGRGGVDREYKSDVKSYTQNTGTSDIVVGVKTKKTNGDDKTDFYFVPTILIEKLNQKSISANKLEKWKNNWKILEECKNEAFVLDLFQDLLNT